MFHTYVLAYSGTPVDFNRASFLMDKKLFQQSLDAMELEQIFMPRHDATYGAQWVWDYYCERHREKYHMPFAPNVIVNWDRPAPSAPSAEPREVPPTPP